MREEVHSPVYWDLRRSNAHLFVNGGVCPAPVRFNGLVGHQEAAQ